MRLVVGGGDSVYRSATPVRDGDQSAAILKGPGCGERATFEPDLKNDDAVKVSIRNEVGQKVLVRQIDNQHRWQRLGELAPGEEKKLREWSSNAARQNARIMVSDPVDDTCLGLYTVSEDDESVIVAEAP